MDNVCFALVARSETRFLAALEMTAEQRRSETIEEDSAAENLPHASTLFRAIAARRTQEDWAGLKPAHLIITISENSQNVVIPTKARDLDRIGAKLLCSAWASVLGSFYGEDGGGGR